VVEYLVAKGEAVDGRGFRRTDEVDDTVDRPLGLPETLEIEGILDLFGKGSCGGLLTDVAEGRSDEAEGVSDCWLVGGEFLTHPDAMTILWNVGGLAERHYENEMVELRRSKFRKWIRVTAFTAYPERVLLE
jgi:hypothetical protein